MLTSEALESEVAVLAAQIDAAEHRLLALIRELERRQHHRHHGLGSLATWLGWRIGLGAVAAREKVRVAKALGDLPHIDAALSRGEVSYSKVRAMTRVATPENEQKLLVMAQHATAAQLERICRGVEQVTSTSSDTEGRWVRLLRCKNGMMRLEARLHADEAALVMKAVDLARGEDVSAEAEADVSAEARKPASGPDALLRVADAFIAGQRPEGRPGGERHHIVVCVREDALMPEGVAAEVADAPVHVPPETLRRLACDASLTRVTTDPDGTPLDVGRKTRTVPPAMRRALLVRDKCCRFPGCDNRKWLDAHHIEHWMRGGATARDNLVLLCPTHHRLVHEGGFGLRRDDTGAIVFTRPDGSEVRAEEMRAVGELPTRWVRAARAPWSNRPDYNWAIGVVAPVGRRLAA